MEQEYWLHWRNSSNGSECRTVVKGTPITIDGLNREAFYHAPNYQTAVKVIISDKRTGYRLGSGFNLADAIDDVKNNLQLLADNQRMQETLAERDKTPIESLPILNS